MIYMEFFLKLKIDRWNNHRTPPKTDFFGMTEYEGQSFIQESFRGHFILAGNPFFYNGH